MERRYVLLVRYTSHLYPLQEIVLNYASQLLDRFKQLTNNHTGSDKWDTVLLGGLIGSLFSFLQFIVSPIIGRASDRIGRRRVLLYTMVRKENYYHYRH